MAVLKLRKVGNSVGATFPAELLARLEVGEGDTLHVVETPDGLLLSPYNPDFEAQLAVARRVMQQNRTVLRALAK